MDASRGKTMKSVSIMWAEGVSESEARTTVATVRDVVRLTYEICLKAGILLSPTAIRPFGTWVIPSIPTGDPYSGTHWYIDTAYDARLGKVVAARFLELVRKEPWQTANPHFDVAILDRDMTAASARQAPAGESILAAVLPGIAAVISVYQVRAAGDLATRSSVLRRLVVHNFGHVLEVPAADRAEAVERSDGELHCTNLCVMRHASTATEVANRAREEAAADTRFCPACRRDILRSVLRQRLSTN